MYSIIKVYIRIKLIMQGEKIPLESVFWLNLITTVEWMHLCAFHAAVHLRVYLLYSPIWGRLCVLQLYVVTTHMKNAELWSEIQKNSNVQKEKKKIKAPKSLSGVSFLFAALQHQALLRHKRLSSYTVDCIFINMRMCFWSGLWTLGTEVKKVNFKTDFSFTFVIKLIIAPT